MFGLSIGKILLILAAIVVLLFGSRILRQLKRNAGDFGPPDGGQARGGPTDRQTGQGNPASPGSAADLIQCQACGAFAAANCGKPGCPLA